MSVVRSGSTAVITGAGSGIGRGLALELADRGMNIVLVGRRMEKLEKVAAEASAIGVRAIPVTCDVSDLDEVARLHTRALAEFGSVELLCLNAATATAGALIDAPVDDWEWVFRTNVLGVVHCIRAFAPGMVDAGRGHLLITGSISGLVPDAVLWHGPYASVKSAVNAIAMNLRVELEGTGVGVSLLVPGPTGTDMVNTSAYRPNSAATTAPDLTMITPRAGSPVAIYEHFVGPEEVARRTVAGIERDVPVIASHHTLLPLVEEFCDRMVTSFRSGRDLETDAPDNLSRRA